MKQKKFNKKLMLNKTTVADLNDSQMNSAKGGKVVLTYSMVVRCYVCESDGDPCNTIQTICPTVTCPTAACVTPACPTTSVQVSMCVRCFG